MSRLKVLFVAAEVSPYAKVGGLADVAGSLPQALARLGHDVRVVMPSYRMVEERPEFELRRVLDDLSVTVGPNWTKRGYVNETRHGGVPVYLIGTDAWFSESVSSQTVYLPGKDQYLFFSAAVLETARRLNWRPDVVHCHDWHTGFTPVLMRERHGKAWDEVAAVFTIHNLAYQGEFGRDTLDKVGLPPSLFNMHQLETFGSVNFLKSGCVYSDEVTTVSPTYAREIQTPEYGCRLDGLMQHLARTGRLHGILNGISLEEFDPATDPYLARNYSAADLSGKAQCRADLLARLGLPEIPGAPLLGVVSRLSGQKGIDLVLDAAERLLALPCQLVVQGLGDAWLAARLEQLQERHPDRVRFIQAFDVPSAQRIYAGSDAFLMPSAFEPCGLGQMIAMRYGTVPLVRKTGGLADTVREGENGFVFEERSAEAFMKAAERLYQTYQDADAWRSLALKGLEGDYSWERSAREYVTVYEKAVASRPR